MRAWIPAVSCVVVLTVRVGVPDAPAPSPPSLTGTVVSAEGGAPLKDARVDVYQSLDTEARRERRAAGSFVEDPIATGVTDGKGRFSVEVPPGMRVLVAARGAGRGSVRIASLVTPGAGEPPKDLGRAELAGGRRLQGRVVDPGGKPIAGVRVTGSARQTVRMGPFAMRTRASQETAPPPAATTGKDGSFVLEGLPERPVVLRAYAAGFAPHTLPEPRAGGPLTLHLTQGLPLTGRVVTPAGEPAPGAWVLAGEDGLEGTVRCDGQGQFRFERLAPGERTLVATGDAIVVPHGDKTAIPAGPSWAASSPQKFTLPQATGAAAPRLALRPGAVVRARALDAETLSPVAGAWLALDQAGEGEARTAVAAERGEVVFTGVPAGASRVLASAEGRIDEMEGPRPLRAGETWNLAVALTGAATLEGTVRDAAGHAVPGARVTVSTSPAMRLPIAIPINIPYGEPVATDSAGRFLLEKLPARRPLRLAVEVEGFIPWEATDMRLRPAEHRTGMEIWLDAGLMITGRLVDKDGTVVAGAALTATHHAEQGGAGGMVVMRMASRGGAGRRGDTRVGGVESLPEVTSGNDGVFRVRGARPGVWSVEARARGFAPKSVSGLKLEEGARTLDAGDIVMEPGAAVKGRVVDLSGQPIPYARGVARKDFDILAEITGGPDGTFVVEDLEPGLTMTLGFTADGHGDREVTGVTAPVDDLTITLPVASRLSGQVTDQESRRPVQDFSISVARERSMGGGGFVQMSRNLGPEQVFHDENGAFTVEGISPGKVVVTVRAPGYEEATLRDVEIPEGKDVEGLSLLVDRAASISGVVVDDAGRPIPGVSVAKSEGSSGRGGFRMMLGPDAGGNESDGEGRFSVQGLEPGPVTLSFTHPEYEPAERDVDAAQDVTNLRVAMTRGAALTGIVLRDEDGSPVPSATIVAQSAGSGGLSGGMTARSGPDGAFQIDGVRAGSYMISASATGLRPLGGPQNIVVSPGAPLPPVELRLGGGVALSGMLVGLKESELPNMTVTAFTPGTGGFTTTAAVDASGSFDMKGIPPGTLTLRAGASMLGGGRSVTRTVQIPEGVPTFETTLEFPRGRRVEGVVTRGDQPIAEATVMFSLEATRSTASATTDTAGRYAVEDLDEGDYSVNVMQLSAGLSHSTKVSVKSDRTFDIELPTKRLAGTVLDASSGKPLEHATVLIEPEGGRRTGGMIFRDQSATDASGAFDFDGLAEGVWNLSASRDGYAVQSRAVRIVPTADPEPIVFELSRADGLTFRATDARSGTPLSRLAALVLPPGGGDPLTSPPPNALFRGELSADASGTFHLDSLGPGDYTVVLGGAGLATRTMRGITVPAQDASFVMEPGGTLEVDTTTLKSAQTARAVVLNDEGLPLHWQMFLSDPTFLLRPGAPTTLRDLPAGSYRVRAALPGGVSAEKIVTIASGSTARVTLP
ncbi:MAG: carboxypeptidase regulatory-like domain-containing protein [Candidatus Polarisedimenticolia bacterium]